MRFATPRPVPTTSWPSRSRRAARSIGGASGSRGVWTSSPWWRRRPTSSQVPRGCCSSLTSRASGSFVGLTARHGRAQLTRAIMEGVVLSMRDGLEVMRALGTAVDEVRATGGGARSPLWLQLQADVYGCPIRRTGVDEGPAYGAALLAGLASGVFTDLEAATSTVRLRESIIEPDPTRARRYDEL